MSGKKGTGSGQRRWLRQLAVSLGMVGLLGLGGCAEETPSGQGAASQDIFSLGLPEVTAGDAAASTDSGSADTGSSAGDAAADNTAAKACPGGPGCSCATDAGCDTGLCLDTSDGKQCAQKCAGSGCPTGMFCAQVTAGTDILQVCVPSAGRYCNPCLTTADCTALALPGAACVSYGDAGRFCGVPCKVQADCPSGAQCSDATTAEGTPTKQCTAAPAKGATGLGICPCSKAAQAASLSTTCSVPAKDATGAEKAKCSGSRLCGPSGLTACALKNLAADTCNGIDDDCDGTVDNPATAVCEGGKGCVAGKCEASCTPTDGGWTAWTEGACSKTCGGGSKTLSRTCSNPSPSCGGKACVGEASKSEACNTQSCETCTPVDGGWTEWVNGVCSKTCGGGTLTATRSCSNPQPSCGGKACTGDASKQDVCNTAACTGDSLPLGTTVYADGGTVVKGAVPAGISVMKVHLWGGGGAGGAPGTGGGAAWVQAEVPVKAGDQVELRVAEGGLVAGGGGGASYVIVNGAPVVIAGGGGGGGSDGNSGNGKPQGTANGGPAGAAGGQGSPGNPDNTYNTNAGGGGGGSQTAGGAAGVIDNKSMYTNCTVAGTAGSQHTGGQVTQAVNDCKNILKGEAASWHKAGKGIGNGSGGGGGSGWYGGGSGAAMWTYTGGGGGGSSWIQEAVSLIGSNGGLGQAAGGNQLSSYAGQAGRGGDGQTQSFGNPATPGNAGRIVLTL